MCLLLYSPLCKLWYSMFILDKLPQNDSSFFLFSKTPRSLFSLVQLRKIFIQIPGVLTLITRIVSLVSLEGIKKTVHSCVIFVQTDPWSFGGESSVS